MKNTSENWTENLFSLCIYLFLIYVSLLFPAVVILYVTGGFSRLSGFNYFLTGLFLSGARTFWVSWNFFTKTIYLGAATFTACCISCSALQKPSTFPSSICKDLLWGDSCMPYMGVISHVLYVQQQYFLHMPQQRSRSIPPRPNKSILSCTLPC